MRTTLDATAQELSLQLWKWLTLHPKTKALLLASILCTISTFINIENARAADGGQTINTLYLPLDHITDSHGVPISAYLQLPLDNGNVTHPIRSARAFTLNILWMFYALGSFVMIATVDFILGLTWLDWILSPLFLLASSVQFVTAKFIIIPAALTLSAFAGAVLYLRGHKTTALVEVAVAIVISGFALSPLANPVTYFKGDNGVIQQSAQYGNEIGQILTTGEDTKTSPISAAIIDVTLRTPVQIVSFGKHLEGECATTFDDMNKAGDEKEDIRNAINGCDEVAKANNETDSFLALAFLLVFGIGFHGLWLIVGVLVFFILKDSFFAVLNGINVIWRFPLAVMPWGTRYGLYNSFSQMWVNIAAVGIYIALTSVYLWLYARVTEFTGGTFMIYQNFILGVIALVMAYSLFKMKRNGKNLGQKLSQRLSKLGVTKEASPRQPSKLASSVKTLAQTAGGLYAMNRGFTRTGTASNIARTGITAVTGGTAAVATAAAATAGAAFAENMGQAANHQRLEAARTRAALQPAYRNGDGSIPMPATKPQTQPTTKHTPKPTKDIEPTNTPTTTPQKPTTKTPMAPGRYGNVRLDHNGKPHTINKPIDGEIVEIPDSKLRTLKLLDSYDATTQRNQPRRFTTN